MEVPAGKVYFWATSFLSRIVQPPISALVVPKFLTSTYSPVPLETTVLIRTSPVLLMAACCSGRGVSQFVFLGLGVGVGFAPAGWAPAGAAPAISVHTSMSRPRVTTTLLR